MTRYRLPGKFSQRVFAPAETIQREGETLHCFNISTTDKPAYKWFNEKQLTEIKGDNMPITPVFKDQEITIGGLTAVYSHFIDSKQMHVIRVGGDDKQCIRVSEEWLQQTPDGCALPVGTILRSASGHAQTIIDSRYPFYRVEWNNGFNTHAQTEWLRDDQLWQKSNILGTFHTDPYQITLPEIEMTKPETMPEREMPDIEKALYTEMLSKIEALKAQVDEQSAELAKAQMEKEQLERELKKAKNTVTPIGEVDAIKAERDSLKAQVTELAMIRKERDQLRSQLAVLAQEKPQAAESGDVAIVVGETASGMAKRKKEGYAPIHMQFEGGKLNVVYERTENAVALPVERHAAITIPARQSDYISALNNHAVGADELTAIGNERIMQAGANIFYGKKAE